MAITRSMSQNAHTYIFVDHVRLCAMLLPLFACACIPLEWVNVTIPMVWWYTTKDLRPRRTMCPLWRCITLFLARGILVQAGLFFQLSFLFKVHAMVSLVYLSVFLALTVWSYIADGERRFKLTDSVHIVY